MIIRSQLSARSADPPRRVGQLKAPSRPKAAISPAPMPSSPPSTASLCWFSSAAPLAESEGAAKYLTGWATRADGTPFGWTKAPMARA